MQLTIILDRGREVKLPPLRSSAAFAALLACVVAVTCGCGNRTGLVPVSGKVVFESRDLPQVCRLTFLPVGESGGPVRPGSATMSDDGSYELTEFRGIQGLYSGEYKVGVAYYDLKPGGNENNEADWIEVVFEAPEMLVVDPKARHVEFDVVVP